GRLAGEQEAILRALVAEGEPAPDTPAGMVDLGALLRRHASPHVTIAAPAQPVLLPADQAHELAAAVAAALDNVRVHCGSAAPAVTTVRGSRRGAASRRRRRVGWGWRSRSRDGCGSWEAPSPSPPAPGRAPRSSWCCRCAQPEYGDLHERVVPGEDPHHRDGGR